MREGIFQLGEVQLSDGGRLEDAFLAYAAWGKLDPDGANCVLIPTFYAGTHHAYAPLIGPGRALDPDRWFIVVVDMFGNGQSSSPSHRPRGPERAAFPPIGVGDNVLCQHRLLTEHLGVRRVKLATGWSMGAMQALWWGALFGDMVEALAPICGSASCWPLNKTFLDGVCAALRADGGFAGGAYLAPPERGLRAFGRAYAGWAYSAAFFRDGLYRQLGCETLEAFLDRWEDEHLGWDACDLLAMASTWRTADVSRLAPDGRWRTALRRISARVVLMPCDRDAYFTLEECALEAACLPNAELRPLRSPFGHCAGAPGRFPLETAAVEAAMRALLT